MAGRDRLDAFAGFDQIVDAAYAQPVDRSPVAEVLGELGIDEQLCLAAESARDEEERPAGASDTEGDKQRMDGRLLRCVETELVDDRGLARDAAQLLGGDGLVIGDQPLPADFETRAQIASLKTARMASFVSMARAPDERGGASRLVAVKAVSAAYPLRGVLRIDTRTGDRTRAQGGEPGQATAHGPERGTVWAEANVLDALGLQVGDSLQLGDATLRIAARRPRLGLDTDHRTIPHEAGWIGTAVHLDKGCYRGQETVARVQNLGRPPRRLVFLHLDGSVDHLPAHGDPIELAGRTVGFVGSTARHYELGPIALAVVRRATPDDAQLLAGGVPAAIESLPGLTGKEEPAVRLR